MVCFKRSIRARRDRSRKFERKDEETRFGIDSRGLYVSDDQRVFSQKMRKNNQAKKTLSWLCIYQIQDER